jgi:hypothetical protein
VDSQDETAQAILVELRTITAELRQLNERTARAETALGHLVPRLVAWGRSISQHPKIARLLKQ